MLTVVLDTKYLEYGDEELGAICKNAQPGGIAYCQFLPYKTVPICNVLLECFDSRFFRITDKQQHFYSMAISVMRSYNEAEKQCLDDNYLWSMFESMLQVIQFNDSDSRYCNPDYYIMLMRGHQELEPIGSDQYIGYILVLPSDLPQISGKGDGFLTADGNL